MATITAPSSINKPFEEKTRGNLIASLVLIGVLILGGLIYYVMTSTTRSNMGNVESNAISAETPRERADQVTGTSQSGEAEMYPNTGTSGTYTGEESNTAQPVKR